MTLLCWAMMSVPQVCDAFVSPQTIYPKSPRSLMDPKVYTTALFGTNLASPWRQPQRDDKETGKDKKTKQIQVQDKKSDHGLFQNLESRQLLGLKNPAHSLEKWKIRVQLTKPVTWIPLSLIVMCGAAASGNYHWMWNPWNVNDRDVLAGLYDAFLGFWTVILAGPFSEGFAQTINDWYDRDIDAINEPYRPIPSGAITQQEVFEQLAFLFMGGTAIAMGLDWAVMHNPESTRDFPIVTAITLFGYFMSYIYSAPPLKLKQNGWTGDLAIGLCYISLPWLCGRAVFGTLDQPVDWAL